MKQYLCGASAAALLLGLASTAGAADLPVEIPVVEAVPVAPLWSGFYVGGAVGYNFNADIHRNPRFNDDLNRRLDDHPDETPDCYTGTGTDEPGALKAFLEDVDLSSDTNVSVGPDGQIVLEEDLTVPDPADATATIDIDAGDFDQECIADFLADRDDPSRAVLGPYGVERDSDEGWEAGVYVGADAQFGQFVLGVIGDFNWIDLQGDVLARDGAGTEVFRATADLDWYATLRARAGIAFDRFLVYGHGGLAYSKVEFEGHGRNVGSISGDTICFEEEVAPAPMAASGIVGIPPIDPPIQTRLVCYDDVDPTLVPVAFSDEEDLWGYAIGVGGEALLTENVSAKLEYQYTNLGEESFGGLFDETESAEVEIDFHTVRLGVAFRF